MLVLTIQDIKNAEMLYTTGYTPNLLKSEYPFLAPRYARGYDFMMKKLYEKDPFGKVESFYWGWVKNPYLPFHRFKHIENKVGIFLDVPPSKIVISDYDKYCEYLEDETPELVLEGDNDCLQGVFRRIQIQNIRSVIPAKNLLQLYDNGIEDIMKLYINSKNKDISKVLKRSTDLLFSGKQLVSALG